MVQAWYMDDSSDDHKLPHKINSGSCVSLADLAKIGVGYHQISDLTNYELELDAFREQIGYNYKDQVTITPDKLPSFDQMMKAFYEEHLHVDDAVRYVVDGSGYFDVRDREDSWIRILAEPGDLLIIPAGIYHRFTVDTNNYVNAVRFFQNEPVWTPYNRPVDEMDARKLYVQKYCN